MSVNFNLVSAELKEEDHASILDSVKFIESKLPFAITLPTEEKQGMVGIGVKTIDFIDKTFEYAAKNPDLTPGFLDMVEFEKDVKLLKQLQTLKDHLVPLVAKLNDTHAILGSEAYNSGRVFYHHVKNASRANVPGASAVAKELGKRFKVVRHNGSPDDEVPDRGENGKNLGIEEKELIE